MFDAHRGKAFFKPVGNNVPHEKVFHYSLKTFYNAVLEVFQSAVKYLFGNALCKREIFDHVVIALSRGDNAIHYIAYR